MAEYILTHSDTEIDHSVLPDGTRMIFYQAAAPTYWVVIESTGDHLVAISDTVNKYRGYDGGGIVSTEVINTHTHTMVGYQLTISEMPSHLHYYPCRYIENADYPAEWGKDSGGQPTTETNPDTGEAGGNTTHTHGVGSAQALTTWKPQAIVSVVCEKTL